MEFKYAWDKHDDINCDIETIKIKNKCKCVCGTIHCIKCRLKYRNSPAFGMYEYKFTNGKFLQLHGLCKKCIDIKIKQLEE